jgi:hypothetical protein
MEATCSGHSLRRGDECGFSKFGRAQVVGEVEDGSVAPIGGGHGYPSGLSCLGFVLCLGGI